MKHSSYAVEDVRRTRCLKIVEHVYWSGSASSGELSVTLGGLSGTTDTSVHVIDRDIGELRRNGLPMSVDGAGRWRIDAMIPGFALRLTKAQASVLWAGCVACRSSDRLVAPRVCAAELSAAVAILLSGLRQFHRGSEVLGAADGATVGPEVSRGGEPERRIQARELTGEARLVHRRLRILDLIEGRRALNTGQLAAMLDISQRTVHDDLDALRRAGLELKFCRRSKEFQTKGLNSYLAGRLTLPTAAGLLTLFTPTDALHKNTDDAIVFNVASEKLTMGIRLQFARQADDLQELVKNFQASGDVS